MSEVKIEKQQIIEKRAVIDEIKEKIQSASAFYVTKYDGIDVENISRLRRELRTANSEMKVFKNKLVIKALEGTKHHDAFEKILKGPNSMTFAFQDPAAPAKIFFEFAKKNTKLEIRGCLFENEFYGSDKMSIIKDLPSKDALLSMIASVLNEPMAKLARTLDSLRLSKEAN
jgi:large subunit ribosomal protein L10